MITVDFGIVPIGTEETDLGDYVSVAVQAIKDSGLSYELTGMGTQIEAENLDELYEAVQAAQEAVFKVGANRVFAVLKIDDRRDKDTRGLKDKVDTVNAMIK
ncbi:MTH1187 family thiamine-binding protein [Methanobrevibacter sp. TMH8]|uniref:MTH1187 family thiamine-binding protein n=1 Tax=Methanobrevibacter sp. TMH8 TaxID=2848611 RepID=UPI001CC97535|nr:MTH1187 family thiamine-binding protein [Methanobrevibacter sp. TMH8]MBZ9570277.1 MTH1187 family thiamine-binding protein [Methanobrevibacter sp. TMH8]